MKILLIAIAKTDDKNLATLIAAYQKRIGHYCRFEFIVIPANKKWSKLSQLEQKEAEGSALLELIDPADRLILLDEKGKEFSSEGFAQFIQKQLNSGIKQIVFAIGGPYGFSDEVYSRAQYKMALSRLTFSHQMVRLFFAEQLYRAFTILRNEPYHHR
jgi:23S rRNA (pseudouridine1915-N3)-methyltransferase